MDIIELGNEFFDQLDIDKGIIVAQLYHPNIPSNHGGGQFRFWGKYYDQEKNYLSTVHSLALNYEKFVRSKIYGRNYFPKLSTTQIQPTNVSLQKEDFKKGNTGLSMGGYNLVLDDKYNALSIWHMGPAYDIKNENYEVKKSHQCFWVPKSKTLNPRIIIDNKETFLNKNEKQFLNIKIIINSKIVNEKNLEFNDFFECKLNEIFEQKFETDYIVYLEFSSKIFSYAQINYDNQEIGDQIHTHKANYYYNDMHQLKYFTEEKIIKIVENLCIYF